MDKKRTARRAVEIGKDILILLLTCSALWLAIQTPLLEPLNGLLAEETVQTGVGQAQTEGRAETARPLRITAVLARESKKAIRFGALCDAEACDSLFQQVAGLLMEAMSSAGAPEQIPRWQWEWALTDATGVCVDFQGNIPMEVLSGWLVGEDMGVEAVVRRLSLSVWEDTVALYYRDVTTGNYFRCQSEVVDPARLEEALYAISDNGAFYAFESEAYSQLDPDTLLSAEPLSPMVYGASNPVSGEQAVLETLAGDLGFSINPNGIYYAGEWVARSGNDTLRLSDDGMAVYLAGDGGGEHFSVASYGVSGEQFDAVETCRQLAMATVGSRCGGARLYLSSVEAVENGFEVVFEYSLSGLPVHLESGSAASFRVENGRVTQFTLCFRSYAEAGQDEMVLPARQAAAAMESMGVQDEELVLVYLDGGGEVVSANWAAWGG